jgi:hypothetical protein
VKERIETQRSRVRIYAGIKYLFYEILRNNLRLKCRIYLWLLIDNPHNPIPLKDFVVLRPFRDQEKPYVTYGRNVVLSSAFPGPRWSSNGLYRLFAKTWFWFHGLPVSQKTMVRQYLKRPWSASTVTDLEILLPAGSKKLKFKTKFVHLYWKSNHIHNILIISKQRRFYEFLLALK